MKTLKQLVITTVLATASLAAFSTPTFAAQEETPQNSFVRGADYAMYLMNRYHTEIESMSPEDRSKLTAMQDKLMQMEMDQGAAKMKMEMEIAKTERDIQMFIYSASRARGQNAN